MESFQFLKLLLTHLFVIFCAGYGHNQYFQYPLQKAPNIKLENTSVSYFPEGKIVDSIKCNLDTSQSFALYLPTGGNNSTLPVIYFFDPHGDGSFPLGKYQKLADHYHFLMIGSNNSKNGNDWALTENIVSTLFADSRQRLKIAPNRIFTCGFSGGAKVACFAAWKHPEVKTAIACGAGLPEGLDVGGNFRPALTLISGEGDMNLTEMVALDKDLDKRSGKNIMVTFDGVHEWPPEKVMEIAITDLQLDAMREKIIPISAVFVQTSVDNAKNSINYSYRENNLVKADEQCKVYFKMFSGLSGQASWFSEKRATLESSLLFRRQLKSLENLYDKERNLKEQYQEKFQQGDVNYWKETIKSLQTKTKLENGEKAMNQRLLAYLSLAFYSISNQLINANHDSQASFFVELYKLADPANSEAWYFSAILHARNREIQATEQDLLQSVQKGFSDKRRMNSQPEFKMIAIDLSKVEKKMR